MSKIIAKWLAALILFVWMFYVLDALRVSTDLKLVVFWAVITVLRLTGEGNKLPWHYCAAFFVMHLVMYLAYRTGHKRLHDMLSDLRMLILFLYIWHDGANKWFKKKWGKLRSSALTAVNAASFKRQAKEAL